jgi:putative ABC transport system permease protein
MFGYYLRLAGTSFSRNRGLTTLMACTIAFGIAISVVTITVYHLLAGNPIWWKNDRLYAVTMDNWPAVMAPTGDATLDYGPMQLTYKDATHLMASDIPLRKVVSFKDNEALSGGTADGRPRRVMTRVTTADFFAIFDVPFLYGSGWTAKADSAPSPVIVLSREQNQKSFGGANSVGRTIRWHDRDFRVVGVLDDWQPMPKYFDINNGPAVAPEDAYVPFGWLNALQLQTSGEQDCLTGGPLHTFEDLLGSECIWLQMWVELPNAAAREQMQNFMDLYWADQHKLGRFARPRNNRLTTVSRWLDEHQMLAGDDRLLIGMGLAFFAVCVVNVVGLLLAKFLSRAASTGVRRALGASRRHIVMQHLVEAAALAALGALLGLVLAELSLWGVHAWIDYMQSNGLEYHSRMHFDLISLFAAIGLAVVAALAAGLYPAWRVGRLPPATYLKSQ